jgi:hypothetical protein
MTYQVKTIAVNHASRNYSVLHSDYSGALVTHWRMAIKMAAERDKHGRSAEKRSTDPAEAKGTTEPEQPDQT